MLNGYIFLFLFPQHLLLACPFARQTWHIILDWMGMPTHAPDHEPTVMDWWLCAKEHMPPTQRKALKSIAMLVPWMIWKHRTEHVINNARPSIDSLVDRIKDKVRCWGKAGAQGLKVVLPTSWDVHWSGLWPCKTHLLGGLFFHPPFQCNEMQRSFAFSQKKRLCIPWGGQRFDWNTWLTESARFQVFFLWGTGPSLDRCVCVASDPAPRKEINIF